jgi:hypothetical protein
MRADRSQPIPPLSPASIQLLGEPESVLVAAGGRLDHRIKAWLLGVGIVATGGSAAKRETQVRIWILPEGVLLTNITIRQTGLAHPRRQRQARHGVQGGVGDGLQSVPTDA